MDTRGNIVYIQSGFLGHNNDAAQLRMMPRIGNEEELHLPLGLYFLADKGYLCEYPFITPWRQHDVDGDQRRYLFNLEFAKNASKNRTLYSANQRIWCCEPVMEA